MTTASWSDSASHSSDAAFRLWGEDYSDHLDAIGLVQTADTGQIDWATVTRPGSTATAAGYEIWRFDDTLQATAPLYLKIEFGNASNSTSRPGMWVTVGTGTDGAGALTGTTSSRFALYRYNTPNSTASYPNYFCHTEGFVGCVFRSGMYNATGGISGLSFAVARYCDTNGTPNGDGFTLYVPRQDATGTLSVPTMQSVRTASPAGSQGTDATESSNYGGLSGVAIPQLPSSSVDENGDMQAYMHWTRTPTVRPVLGVFSYRFTEAGEGTTISLPWLGGTTRTFISVGTSMGLGHAYAISASNYALAMLWE